MCQEPLLIERNCDKLCVKKLNSQQLQKYACFCLYVSVGHLLFPNIPHGEYFNTSIAKTAELESEQQSL